MKKLRHLEQELAGIQMVPGRTYDLRNTAVPRIVSSLSASANQRTVAQVLPQPQNNLASAGRITRQDRVKTPVNTTQRMGDVERKEIPGTVRVTGRRCGVRYDTKNHL